MGTSKKCLSRHPAGAPTEKRRDEQKFRGRLFDALPPHEKTPFGFAGYGCGHCQRGFPGESENPR